ncbi:MULTISPECIES: hypothetical protein [unclassified Maridesulfovibrio]|uniref:hypothetical protein n=1 Tax=unclassified Maridesulfovibrio TaxID=2794999 RepID=UPI003B3FE306
MKRTIKLLLCLVFVLGLATGAQASAIDAAAKVAGEVAKAVMGKDEGSQKVEVKNSELSNKVNIEQGASIGNSGIKASGKTVSIKNSKIKNDVNIKQGLSVGNSGIELGN